MMQLLAQGYAAHQYAKGARAANSSTVVYDGNKSTKVENWIRVIKENWLFLLIAVLLIFNYRKVVGLFKGFAVDAQNDAYTSQSVTVTVGGVKQKINLTEIAKGIYNCFYKAGLLSWGWSEDEVGAMNYLKKCPKSLIPQLADIYARQGDKPHSLYEDFQTYLSSSQYESIKKFLF